MKQHPIGEVFRSQGLIWYSVYPGNGIKKQAQFCCPFRFLSSTIFDRHWDWGSCESIGKSSLRCHLELHQIAGHLPQTPEYAVKLPMASGILCDGHRDAKKPLRWKRIHTSDCIARDSGLVTEKAIDVRNRFVILMKYR